MRLLHLPLILVAVAAVGLAIAAREYEEPLTARGYARVDAPERPAAGLPGGPGPGSPQRTPESDASPRIRYRDSVAIGTPSAGRLVRGVRLPAEGAHFFTWDPIERERPNRHWRRWGTDDLVRTTLRIAREHRRENAGAPRVAIGDLSRTHGGDFGSQFGSIGHASHQNGLDVDVYYPRHDRAERAPETVAQVDQRLAQDLVDRFVAAGAVKVFVGPSLSLTGPSNVVVPLVNHDNHLHARFAF